MKKQFFQFSQIALATVSAFSVVSANGNDNVLANQPLVGISTTKVKPNVLMILDSSGSMNWGSAVGAPDATREYPSHQDVRYFSSSYNKLYYDPSITYVPPRMADGKSYPDANIKAVMNNFYLGDRASFDMSEQMQCSGQVLPYTEERAMPFLWCGGRGAFVYKRAFYYKFKFENELKTNPKSVSNAQLEDVNNYTLVNLQQTELQNFANWAQYYRTRMLAMKSSTSRAFAELDDSYRVGFMTIHAHNAAWNSNHYLKIDDFTQAQRNTWFSTLFSVPPNGGTPLIPALSNAGRVFAGKMQNDPMQYYCQRNFAILTTDGYWNDGLSESLTGGQVGDADGNGDLGKLGSGSVNGTLSDVAAYYFKTDIRDAAYSNENANGEYVAGKKGSPANDPANRQFVRTYTMGIGVQPVELNGQPLRVVGNQQTTVNDLIDAGKNGGGDYFSAANPEQMVSGLLEVLAATNKDKGGGSAIGLTNINSSDKDDLAFHATYFQGDWYGELQAYKPSAIGEPNTVVWSANAELSKQGAAARNIMAIHNNKLVPFNNTFPAKANIAIDCSIRKVSQCATLKDARLTALKSADNLINYLRGDQSLGMTKETGSFRLRPTVNGEVKLLGDIDKSSPVFDDVNKVVYVGANDGMIHAFAAKDADAAGKPMTPGSELWAIIPNAVQSNLYQLADSDYGNRHRFYVNGNLSIHKVSLGGKTSSILMGGLGKGGKSIFAINVTDAKNPVLLWEFTEADMKYTFGTPRITKIRTETPDKWVVLMPSGYDETDTAGYLYVIELETGKQLAKIKAGSKGGLSDVNYVVRNYKKDNTAEVAYAGDHDGKLWRFDFAASKVDLLTAKAELLADLKTAQGTNPITVAPQIFGLDATNYAVIVGTGRYLGLNDIKDLSQHGIYFIKDSLGRWGGTSKPAAVTPANLVQRTLVAKPNEVDARIVAGADGKDPTSFDWSKSAGWYVTLPDRSSGAERVTTSIEIAGDVVVVGSSVPGQKSACEPGGHGWVNFLNARKAISVPLTHSKQPTASLKVDGPVVGVVLHKTSTSKPDKNGGEEAVITDANGKVKQTGIEELVPFLGRRVAWREVVGE